MFDRGCLGIRIGSTVDPSEVKTVHYWYRTTGRRTRQGIDGGRIDLLQLSIGDQITAWYSSGEWSIPVSDPHSKAALEQLLRKYN